MTQQSGLAKACFIELDENFNDKGKEAKTVWVQFNPETIKVSFANQVNQGGKRGETPKSTPKDNSNEAAEQFVSSGTTKLALQLWFDVTAPMQRQPIPADVRDLTKEVGYFITPKQGANGVFPPAVKFLWGSFHFDGLMDSMEESLEFFSEDGTPLRASVSVTISQQKILEFAGSGKSATPPGVALSGVTPLARAEAGSTLQGMADKVGKGGEWQSIATANGIENPRLPVPGTLINFNAKM